MVGVVIFIMAGIGITVYNRGGGGLFGGWMMLDWGSSIYMGYCNFEMDDGTTDQKLLSSVYCHTNYYGAVHPGKPSPVSATFTRAVQFECSADEIDNCRGFVFKGYFVSRFDGRSDVQDRCLLCVDAQTSITHSEATWNSVTSEWDRETRYIQGCHIGTEHERTENEGGDYETVVVEYPENGVMFDMPYITGDRYLEGDFIGYTTNDEVCNTWDNLIYKCNNVEWENTLRSCSNPGPLTTTTISATSTECWLLLQPDCAGCPSTCNKETFTGDTLPFSCYETEEICESMMMVGGNGGAGASICDVNWNSGCGAVSFPENIICSIKCGNVGGIWNALFGWIYTFE